MIHNPHNPTYEMTYGTRYHDLPENADVADIAKLVRKDLKAAVKAGELPTEFEGHPVTFAVITERFAGGAGIDIEIRGVPDGVDRREMTPSEYDYYPGRVRTTEAAVELKAKLAGYLNAYNFDGSDVMTDYFHVNFYSDVRFEGGWARKEREARSARRKVA